MRNSKTGLGPSLTVQLSELTGEIRVGMGFHGGTFEKAKSRSGTSEFPFTRLRVPDARTAEIRRFRYILNVVGVKIGENSRKKCDYGNSRAQDGLERDCVVHHVSYCFNWLFRLSHLAGYCP